MINTIGSYINKNSFIHRFNPSLKIIILLLFIVVIFLPLGFFGQLIMVTILLIGWAVSKLRWRIIFDIVISCLVMFLLLFIINWLAFKTPGIVTIGSNITQLFKSDRLWIYSQEYGVDWQHGHLWGGSIANTIFRFDHGKVPTSDLLPGFNKYALITVGKYDYCLPYQSEWYTLSTEAFIHSAYITFKIFLMIFAVTLIISTTNSIQLSFAIEDILYPLRYLRVPVNEWAMTISIALRFIPSLLEESQRIMRAQASRGVDFQNGNFRDKIKSLVSLVVPMFSIAFHKADDLANAMEARAYNPRYVRTRYRQYATLWYHWLVTVLVCMIFGFFIIFVTYKMLFCPFGWAEAILMYGGK